MIIVLLIFVLLIIAVVSIFWPPRSEAGKGYPWWVGALAGFLLGLIGVLIMALVSDRTIPSPPRSRPRSLDEAFAANRQRTANPGTYSKRTAADYLPPPTKWRSMPEPTGSLPSTPDDPGTRGGTFRDRPSPTSSRGQSSSASSASTVSQSDAPTPQIRTREDCPSCGGRVRTVGSTARPGNPYRGGVCNAEGKTPQRISPGVNPDTLQGEDNDCGPQGGGGNGLRLPLDRRRARAARCRAPVRGGQPTPHGPGRPLPDRPGEADNTPRVRV